jgi:hypothetical protein
MSMNKLWAAVLTGVLACSAVTRAADSTPPTSPYGAPPVVMTPTTDDTKEVKKKVETVHQIDPLPPGNLKPVATKWADEKATTVIAPAPLPLDAKVTALPASHSCGACGPSCGTCAPVISPKPCDTCGSCASAKPCGTCGGCGLGGGKLRGWFSYHPCRTPMGECAADYRIPPVYTFFLDVPCHESWKPVACCDQPCGKCAKRGPTCGGCAPAAPPAPVDALLPEPVPVMPRIDRGR